MRLGPPGGPAAIQTRLGWTLQGPARDLPQRSRSQNCYLTSVNPETVELLRNEEKLWQVDTLPSKSDKQAKRSREDQEALQLLESKTVRVEHNNVQHYATPLLRKRGTSPYHATKDTVMPSLCGIEKRFAEDEDKASAYAAEMSKLELAGSVRKLTPEEAAQSEETWFIPNHLVEHNGKNRIVFNCSYQFQGRNLNKSLFPGPTLGPSLPGVGWPSPTHTDVLCCCVPLCSLTQNTEKRTARALSLCLSLSHSGSQVFKKIKKNQKKNHTDHKKNKS